MAGLYIHVPFCKQACHYCNFHFSTQLDGRTEMVDAIVAEITSRSNFLKGQPLGSVYLGGGTPSMLTEEELDKLFAVIQNEFFLAEDVEITLEANPDDLDEAKIKQLSRTSINRLSIGIQSFKEQDLRLMNRAHNSKQARRCLELILGSFDNISLDLIYGMPSSTMADWSHNLATAMTYEPSHLSCYALTVEPKTALSYQVEQGIVKLASEQMVVDQFYRLIDQTGLAGYQHYEISNFCAEGRQAIHNTNYWNGVAYLGVGPSAHSFDGNVRTWNVANNIKYINSMAKGQLLCDFEYLDDNQKYNEYVMVRLRTQGGCDLNHIARMGFRYEKHFQQQALKHLELGHLQQSASYYLLTRAGKAYADRIASDLFLVY